MKKLTSYLLLALALISCEKTVETEPGILTIAAPPVLDLTDAVEKLYGKCSKGVEAVRISIEPGCNWLQIDMEATSPEQFTLNIHPNSRYSPNFGMEDREGEVTIFARECPQTTTFRVLQKCEPYLKLYPDSMWVYEISIPATAGTLKVPYASNVTFETFVMPENHPDHSISDCESAPEIDWMTLQGKDEEGNMILAYDALDGETRECKFCVIQTGVDERPLRASVVVRQRSADEIYAMRLWGNVMFARWQHSGPQRVLPEATIEMLIKGEFWSGGNILGIYRLWSLIHNKDRLYLKQGEQEIPLNAQLKTEVWQHLALTFRDGQLEVFIDGELVGQSPIAGNGLPLEYQWAENLVCLRNNLVFGEEYGVPYGEDFYLSEIRIWDKALTSDELKVPDHFFKVDPASEHLLYYWCFKEPGSTWVPNISQYHPLDTRLYIYENNQNWLNLQPARYDERITLP